MIKAPRSHRIYLCLQILAGSTLSYDAAFAEQWSTAINLTGGWVSLENVTHSSTIGTGALIGGRLDGALQDSRTEDSAIGIGFTVARTWGAWSLEGEAVWRYRTDWDAVVFTDSIQAQTNVFSNVTTTSVLINIAREGVFRQHAGDTGNVKSAWRWHAGVGLGAVVNYVDSEYIERGVPNVRAKFSLRDTNTTTDLSWNAFVGIQRPIGKHWSFQARYRYIELGELEAGPFSGRRARVLADHISHELMLGVQRRL